MIPLSAQGMLLLLRRVSVLQKEMRRQLPLELRQKVQPFGIGESSSHLLVEFRLGCLLARCLAATSIVNPVWVQLLTIKLQGQVDPKDA